MSKITIGIAVNVNYPAWMVTKVCERYNCIAILKCKVHNTYWIETYDGVNAFLLGLNMENDLKALQRKTILN